MLFSIYIVQIVYLLFELECEKNENKQKEAERYRRDVGQTQGSSLDIAMDWTKVQKTCRKCRTDTWQWMGQI